MITEDYVSFETAKLLKDKGFYTPYCYYYYFPEIKSKTPCISNRVIPKDIDKYLAPTLQMAMKWLREVHKKNINIIYDLQKFQKTDGSVEDVEVYEVDIITKNGTFYIGNYNHYESAAEAAIQYCLKNLLNK